MDDGRQTTDYGPRTTHPATRAMRVSLIGASLDGAAGESIARQARLLRGRGDDVRVYVLRPGAPDDLQDVTTVVALEDLIGGRDGRFRRSDLIIYHYSGYYDLVESIRGIERGMVLFHYHGLAADRTGEQRVQDMEGRWLAHSADLCLADSPALQRELVERVGCDPDRVVVLPPGEEAGLLTIVEGTAAYTLQEMPPEPEAVGGGELPSVRADLLLSVLADEIEARSDVALRDYVVRSRIPLLGPLVAWARRSLTSHLREPYLDPMIERQVLFNRRVAEWLRQASALLQTINNGQW